MNRLEELRKAVYATNYPPAYVVDCRIEQIYIKLEEASKNGDKSLRDTLARDCACLMTIKKGMDIRPWVNL